MVFQLFDQSQALFRLFAFQLNISLGEVANVRIGNFNVILFESLQDGFVLFRGGNNFKIAAIRLDIFCPGVQSNLQQFSSSTLSFRYQYSPAS